MYRAQNAVTGVYLVRYNTKGKYVHNFTEGFALLSHFIVDAR